MTQYDSFSTIAQNQCDSTHQISVFNPLRCTMEKRDGRTMTENKNHLGTFDITEIK